MHLRLQTSLVATVISMALALGVIARGGTRRQAHRSFAIFGCSVSVWYLTGFLSSWWEDLSIFRRIHLGLSLLVPLTAGSFFRAFLVASASPVRLSDRISLAVGIALLALLTTPLYSSPYVGFAIVAFVILVLTQNLFRLYRAGKTASSVKEQRRLVYIVFVGALATVFAVADYLPYAGLDIPPVGTVFLLVFLYVLAQSVLSDRVLDLYEVFGRLTVLTALSFSIAGILWVLATLDPGNFFLPSVVAALVLLLLFDPLRSTVEARIGQFFFRERHDFERAVRTAKREIATILSLDALADVLVRAFEDSRRVTRAALYLVDFEERFFEVKGYVGSKPAARIEVARLRTLIERLQLSGPVLLEDLERIIEYERTRQLRADGKSAEIASLLDLLGMSVAVPVVIDGQVVGLLGIRDERVRDAFAPEEVQLLDELAGQIGVTVSNTLLHRRLEQRERLAALGEMAAGLAHEIRNPLGAIKASAQYLDESTHGGPNQEFLEVIVEEVDRLNRVVSSFLDYARPTQGRMGRIDVSDVVKRSVELCRADAPPNITIVEEIVEHLPVVEADTERLRQVLINLIRNAIEATGEQQGTVRVRTQRRTQRRVDWVEIEVSDDGPGIPAAMLNRLFVPFITTKEQGTGLGLAISHRIVQSIGGSIAARNSGERGAVFTVRIPSAEEPDEPNSGEISLEMPALTLDVRPQGR